MILQRTMKTVFGKMCRSGFFYFIMAKRPVRRPSETETGMDALGALVVIGLWSGILILMRLLLTS